LRAPGKYIFICVAILAASITKGATQVNKIDSLQNLIRSDKEDTIKAIHLNKLCNKFSVAGNYAQGIEAGKEALELSGKLGFEKGMADAFNNIAVIYNEQADYEKALQSQQRSLEIRERLGDKKGVIFSTANIGNILYEQGKVKESKQFHLTALDLAIRAGIKGSVSDAYKALSQCDSALGDYKGAYQYLKLFKLYHDSLFNEEGAKESAQLNARYESEKKDTEILLLNKEKEKQFEIMEAERRKKAVIIWSVGSGLFLVILFSIFMYTRWRLTRQQTQTIEFQRQLVNKKQEELLGSIHYAKRIQLSLLPTEMYIQKNISRLKKIKKGKDEV